MEVKLSVCKRENLCVDCDNEKCHRHGDPGADCPKWKCDHLTGDCDNCAFIKRYQEEMRKQYQKGEKYEIN